MIERTAQLEAVNDELEAFAYSVSHDLRAPLRAVDGFSRILLEEHASQLPDEAQRYLNVVRTNALQMGQLIDDLLAFSRLGRQPMKKGLVDMRALVRETLADLAREQEGRRIDILIGDLPACQADPVLLKQVLANLLSNALKYTRQRDPAKIEIGVLPQPPGPQEAAVYFVRDNGAGFDMQYAGKLFGVFQRLHRAEDYEGTGVGLAFVHRIISRHGGQVWAEAARRSRSHILFHAGGRGPEPGPVAQVLADVRIEISKEASMPVPIRVLILEDCPEDAELMLHELRRSHFEPEWRRVDTESEFNAHLGWRPDLILSDYSMPLLDSPRALALLRELDLDIPFIVVSGAIGEEVAVAMMRQGATDYLIKDRLARLGSAVRHALSEKQLREETRQAAQALQASEVRFFSFMNNNPALAFVKDRDGRMLYMNNTCEQAWNMTLAQCEGKLDHELWHPEVAGRLRARDLDVLESGQANRTVEEISLRNGRLLQLLSFRFPFADALGQRLLGGVSVDISEQVRAERALSAALAAKEVLLKELHHRVKNNLQVISSLLSMQADSLPDPTPAREAIRETQKRVQSMALVHERLNQR